MIALKIGQRADQGGQASRPGHRVDRLGERPYADMAGHYIVQDLDQMSRRAAKTFDPLDDNLIAFPACREELAKPQARAESRAAAILEDLMTADTFERSTL